MTDPVFATLIKSALVPAFNSANQWLGKARAEVKKTKKNNVSACVSYLEAARTAIRGLEDELDQIMIEAEQVAQYYWEKKNRAELAKRITTYLHQDKLRPILDESLSGIEKCSEFAGKDICGFFGRADQKKTHAVKLLEELYAEMHKYLVGLNKISLVGLSKTTSYTEANYAGPSGLNIPELLDLRELLKDKTTEALLTDGTKIPATEEKRREKAVSLVAKVQEDRDRRGFATAAKAKGVMQELIVAFSLEVPDVLSPQAQHLTNRKQRTHS
jgi:hypothetical protein